MFRSLDDDSGSRATDVGSGLSMHVAEGEKDEDIPECGQYLDDTTVIVQSSVTRLTTNDDIYEECTEEKTLEVTASKQLSAEDEPGKKSEKVDEIGIST